MIPEVRLCDREQDVPDELPLTGALGHRHVEIGVWHVAHGLDHQRQQRDKIDDEQKDDFLDFRRAKPNAMLRGMKTTVGT